MNDTLQHVINCATDPRIPYASWNVAAHTKRGQVTWNPSQFRLHLSPNQKGGKSIQGHKLRKKLASEFTENANVLDYLLKRPHLIPDEWKRDENGNIRYILFWSTIYRGSGNLLYVRYLYFNEGHWQANYRYLGREFDGTYPSLVRVS